MLQELHLEHANISQLNCLTQSAVIEESSDENESKTAKNVIHEVKEGTQKHSHAHINTQRIPFDQTKPKEEKRKRKRESKTLQKK